MKTCVTTAQIMIPQASTRPIRSYAGSRAELRPLLPAFRSDSEPLPEADGSNSPTSCGFPDSFKNPTIRNIPAAPICKTHSRTFMTFAIEPELESDRCFC